ncbi:MAG: ATPase [Candidatus Atribacteria bacterium]|nr:ATPase [Candidatus Atribacteria bacterium]MCD6349447.1 ATPase [Candidatus Atribacteria bacterium]
MAAKGRWYLSRRTFLKLFWGSLLFLGICSLAVFGLSLPSALAQSESDSATPPPASSGLGLLGAGLATGLAAIGAGIAVGIAGSSAIGAISEKPELFGRTLTYVGLAEGIAIYGMIISVLILGRM